MLRAVKSHPTSILAVLLMTLFVAAGCANSSPVVPKTMDPARVAARQAAAKAPGANGARPIPFVFLVRYDQNGTPSISSSAEPVVTRTPAGIYRITFAPTAAPSVASK